MPRESSWSAVLGLLQEFPVVWPEGENPSGRIEHLSVDLTQDTVTVTARYRSQRGSTKTYRLTASLGQVVQEHSRGFRSDGEGGPDSSPLAFAIYETLEGTFAWNLESDEGVADDFSRPADEIQ